MDSELRRRQAINKGVSRFIPAFLVCIVAYACWVIIHPLCINYLINTPSSANVEERVATGIAIPIATVALLIPMAVTYLRLLMTAAVDNKSYIPSGQDTYIAEGRDEEGQHRTIITRSCTPTTIADRSSETSDGLGQDKAGGKRRPSLDREGIFQGRVPPPPGLEAFYSKDVFVCDPNGLPEWCNTCHIWKPDRSHHCSDVGRCCAMMDHFCPWVGGVVAEHSLKFFVQFVAYAALFTAYATILLAFFVAETRSNTGGVWNVHWVVGLGLAAFFLLFTLGMTLMTLQNIMKGVTTIENLDVGSRVMHLAVLLPPHMQPHGQSILQPPPTRTITPPDTSGGSERPLTSDLDDPSHSTYFSRQSHQRSSRSRSQHGQHDRQRLPPAISPIMQGTITYPLHLPQDRPPVPAPVLRTFAILRTEPGMNPWDLGPYQNLVQIFGNRLHHWLLPVRFSPCTDHSSTVSHFPLGMDFADLLEDAGLVQEQPSSSGGRHSHAGRSHKSHNGRKKRRLSSGWQNGERPDGWVSEKEARRVRNERRSKMREHHHHRGRDAVR
ncbi:hypothetical protein MBLNU230_g6853t1 [Neophaeotheca triangularis]